MRSAKKNKSLEKVKRLSEVKGSPQYEQKLPKNLITPHHHNRSTSVDKVIKFRLGTDYDEYDHQLSHEKKSQKSYHWQQKKLFTLNSNKYSAYGSSGTQSTKSNIKKNQQLKVLLGKSKNSQEKRLKNKPQHPLVKYIKNKTKVNESPYKKELDKLSYKLKSPLKNKRRISQNNKPNIILKKNHIKIQTAKDSSKKKKEEQQTVKTIKKNVQQSNYYQLQEDQPIQEQDAEQFGLTQEQLETFGERFPFGFQKIRLLGRGGFSLVWLGKHTKSGRQFAIKQIITNNTHQTHMKQIWFGTNFFTLGGIPKPQFSCFPGVHNLVKMYSYEINHSDTWIFYEKCGHSLGNNLYDIRSDSLFGNEKIYKIYFKPFYELLARNPNILKNIVIQLCRCLELLSECQIVHSDLKTENILIRYENEELTEVKLIDYGSSFEFKNISQFSMATPEYMPPQILNYIIHENDGQYQQQLYEKVISNYHNPWCVDIFSLGCVILQLIVGVPLWMSLPLLVPTQNSYTQKEGLFAVKGRLFPEIVKKQRKVIKKIDQVIDNENYSRIVLSEGMRRALKGMLQIDFTRRISPQEVIRILQNQ